MTDIPEADPNDAGSDAPVLQKIPVGISSCLLGNEVRFDGGHKKDSYITTLLVRFFEFHSICPEVEIGLGIPREPIRLMKVANSIRAVGVKNPDQDVTERLQRFTQSVIHGLQHLRGFLLKSKSPSCGMSRVKVYRDQAPPENKGTGIFAQGLMRRFPLLPVEEEGRLNDAILRENFIIRVYAYDRWMKLIESGVSAAKLVEFHARHKLLLMSHSQSAYRELGRLVASSGSIPVEGLAEAYGNLFMKTLKIPATRKNHCNTLQHLLGYLKKNLDSKDKQEMLELIENYRKGLVPLVVPITLIKHHFNRNPHPYVEKQVYLDPSPGELALRNHV